MLYLAIACNSCAAVLFFLAALKYGSGPVPVTYHRLIMDKESVVLAPSVALILRGLYRAFAGALLALGFLIVALTLGPIRSGEFWAEVSVLLAGLAFVAGASLTPLRIENATGIQTPWRLTLVIGALLLAGFVFSQLA